MNLYRINNHQLSPIKEKPFKLEKEIQKTFEKNLERLLGLALVKSECSIKGCRIDTLAYDPQNKAFIIIEYKRQKNISVVDQGFTYLSLMLENKSDFVLTYNETLHQSMHSKTVDWSQTRVIFVSTGFTENQIQAANFKNMGIELYEIKKHEGDIITINAIKKSKSAPSINTITHREESLSKIREIKEYTEEDHLQDKSDKVRELYETFKREILNLSDNIEVLARKQYIAFKKESNIADLNIQQRAIKIWINLRKGQLDDPKNLARDMSKKRHWGNGDYELSVKDTKNLEYIMSLVKQAVK